MTVGFVLSGGGSLGAVQVGMLRALAEQNVTPDLVVGASVGAINAAWVSSHPGVDGARELAAIWRGVKRSDVFPMRPRIGLQGFLGRRNHLVAPNALRSLIQRHLGFERLEDAPVPLSVVTTEVTTGLEVVLRSGVALDAIAASAAIPGVFPPVRIGDRVLMDGGVANNFPVAHAIAGGATTVYVLPTGYACALPAPPRGALAMALHAVSLLLEQRLAADAARFEHTVDLRVLPPLCPLRVTPVDFRHTEELIERAYRASANWLASPRAESGVATLEVHAHAAPVVVRATPRPRAVGPAAKSA